MKEYVIWFNKLGMGDVGRVGGKNSSLGEMISNLSGAGVKVPGGFATTAQAFQDFLAQNHLATRIDNLLSKLNVDDVKLLAETGALIRRWIVETPFPAAFEAAIINAYQQLENEAGHPVEVAVRSSATAEDLPEASFAGQQETFLNVRGLSAVKTAIHHVFASLYNDRAIAYRVHHGFDHAAVALSAGIQRMVRSDLGASGVLFTLDTESGFREVVFITAAYGLGEMVVQGAVNPDEFYVHKPMLKAGRRAILRRVLGSKRLKMVYGSDADSATVVAEVDAAARRSFSLNDAEVATLAHQALIIEQHYGRPMDIEWGKDGIDGQLYILQARPETVKSRAHRLTRYQLEINNGQILTQGRAIGQKIGAGIARVLNSVKEMDKVRPGDVLVTDMTDPDWEPIMKRAAAIVTNRGGRTCFAGDTKLLTNQGFLTFHELNKRGIAGIRVPSLNRDNLKIEWKPVVALMKKTAPVLRVGFSSKKANDYLDVTPDHKMLNLNASALVDTEMQELLKRGDCALQAQYLPRLTDTTVREQKLAYRLGSAMSASVANNVAFIHTPTHLQRDLIAGFSTSSNVNQLAAEQIAAVVNGYAVSTLPELAAQPESLITTLLHSDEELIGNFLAGVIDHQANVTEEQIAIKIVSSVLLETLIVACLRVGITPTINDQYFYISEKFGWLAKYTQKVPQHHDQAFKTTRWFNARQVFTDYDQQPSTLDDQQIIAYLAECQDSELTQRLNKLLAADCRHIKVYLEQALNDAVVYNLTVADNHNYLVFTTHYSPILVNNCHAAIIARELGIPAVVGCADATKVITDGSEVTVSCAEGDTGNVYKYLLPFKISELTLENMPALPFKIMMNVANPERAFDFQSLPNTGVGLARLEFIINRNIGVHPKALLNYHKLDAKLRANIDEMMVGYSDPITFYIEKLSEGIATIAAAFYPKPVIVRMSDFKSNEYANLIGGKQYEPLEENPMIGFRGAARYIDPNFRDCFDLECAALRQVREERGLTNVEIMIPFVRTVGEAARVIELLAANGLRRGENGLRLIMMCEVPSNALLANDFLQYFDGFSIGSNDLTQLTLGLDRDSGLIAALFDERDPAVKVLLSQAIQACRAQGKYIGICGQGPSDHPDFALWLIDQGISSVSLNPDAVVETWLFLAQN